MNEILRCLDESADTPTVSYDSDEIRDQFKDLGDELGSLSTRYGGAVSFSFEDGDGDGRCLLSSDFDRDSPSFETESDADEFEGKADALVREWCRDQGRSCDRFDVGQLGLAYWIPMRADEAVTMERTASKWEEHLAKVKEAADALGLKSEYLPKLGQFRVYVPDRRRSENRNADSWDVWNMVRKSLGYEMGDEEWEKYAFNNYGDYCALERRFYGVNEAAGSQVERYQLRVEEDEDYQPQNPRKLEGKVGHFALFHRSYDFKDPDLEIDYVDASGSMQELRDDLVEKEGAAVLLPVSATIHSGVTLHAGKPDDRWDSGMLGFAYITRDELDGRFGGDEGRAVKALEDAVEEYSEYWEADGPWYAWEVYDSAEGQVVDSMTGYDDRKACLTAGRKALKEWRSGRFDEAAGGDRQGKADLEFGRKLARAFSTDDEVTLKAVKDGESYDVSLDSLWLDVDRDAVYVLMQDWQGFIDEGKFASTVREEASRILSEVLFDGRVDVPCSVDKVQTYLDSRGMVFLSGITWKGVSQDDVRTMVDQQEVAGLDENATGCGAVREGAAREPSEGQVKCTGQNLIGGQPTLFIADPVFSEGMDAAAEAGVLKRLSMIDDDVDVQHGDSMRTFFGYYVDPLSGVDLDAVARKIGKWHEAYLDELDRHGLDTLDNGSRTDAVVIVGVKDSK